MTVELAITIIIVLTICNKNIATDTKDPLLPTADLHKRLVEPFENQTAWRLQVDT